MSVRMAVKVREIGPMSEPRRGGDVFGKRTTFCVGAANLFHFA